MMVPRALVIERRQARGETRVSEKGIDAGTAREIHRPRSAPIAAAGKKTQGENKTDRREKAEAKPRPTTPPRTATEPVTVPSKPVVIPPRSPTLPTAPPNRRRGEHSIRRGSQRFDANHNPRTVPPSVAALLAVTSIPPPNPRAAQNRRTSGTKTFQKTSIDELLQEWREEDYGSSSNSFGAGSPLDILLERADDPDAEDITGKPPSMLDDLVPDGGDCMSSRSVSSDSIPSVPDLTHDDRSPSTWNSPETPNTRPRRPRASTESRSWKEKIVSRSLGQECPLDHPLLPVSTVEELESGEIQSAKRFTPSKLRPTSTRRTSPKPSFKSNLTASLSALTSSLRSFSNFTATSLPPDDLLTRSLFSPSLPQRYVSEMRPKSSDGVPDAALRRYLNPVPRSERERQAHQRRVSTDEQAHAGAPSLRAEPDFAAAVSASSALDAALDLEGPMILLQPYGMGARGSQRGRKGKKLPSPPPLPASSKSANTEAGRIARAASTGEALRQREPRENSDFLRVIVLEMNMRRVGKLDARGIGRARVWLPPRKAEKMDEAREDAKQVPARWVGVAVESA